MRVSVISTVPIYLRISTLLYPLAKKVTSKERNIINHHR